MTDTTYKAGDSVVVVNGEHGDAVYNGAVGHVRQVDSLESFPYLVVLEGGSLHAFCDDEIAPIEVATRAGELQLRDAISKVYLAGAMTGKPDFGYAEFNANATRLRSLGFEVVNPVEVDADVGHNACEQGAQSHADYMARDIPASLACDAIVVLDDFASSSGARMETAVFAECRKGPILSASTLEPVDPPKITFIEYRLEIEPIDVARMFDVPANLLGVDEPESVCAEADRLVASDRRDSYGHPYDNFTMTGDLITPLLAHKLKDGERITGADFGRIMIVAKLSRDVHSPKRDNRVDGAGYFKCLDLVEQRAAEIEGREPYDRAA